MKIFIFTLVYLFLGAFISVKAYNVEKITNFDVSITASKDGSMQVIESIDYNFGEGLLHGIFRNIPIVSKVGNLYRVIDINVSDVKRDGKSEHYQVDNQPLETDIKIGDPDKTITGIHNYIIIYTVKNGIGSNYEDHDEIYWNVTGNDWKIPIEKASANLTTDFGVMADRVACFSRSADFNAQFCTFPPAALFNPITATDVLRPGEGLTIVASFPVNTFPKSVLRTSQPSVDPDFLNFIKFYIPLMLILNFILAPFLLFLYFKKRPRVKLGPVAVNFDIPEILGKKITPAESGIIDNFKLEANDIIATIFDLAIRKYIKINDVKKIKTLLPDEVIYEIVKLKGFDDVDEFEKVLLERLFRGGDKVLLKDLKTDFYLTFGKLEETIFSSLKTKALYTKNPKLQMSILLTLGLIVLVLGNVILGPVLIFISRKLTGRTQLGDKIDWQVDGLKIFLKAVDRYHTFQSKNLITVEKYIPYAIALGLQDEFMKQLKIIYPDYKPSWYSGGNNFYNIYPGLYTSFGSGITTSAPSSSSGFSGGSSGGGGGGGGGGSW